MVFLSQEASRVDVCELSSEKIDVENFSRIFQNHMHESGKFSKAHHVCNFITFFPVDAVPVAFFA